METRILGDDLKVSAIGLGCMGLSHAYGAPMDEKEAIETIQAAYDAGERFFDTAEIYQGVNPDGSVNYNEELVGKALHDVRNDVVIATKFGIYNIEGKNTTQEIAVDSSPKAIRKSVEGSLKKLNTDHIDLYYQHRIDPKVSPEEVAEVMGDLIKEGKITHWDISEATPDIAKVLVKVLDETGVKRLIMMSVPDIYQEVAGPFQTWYRQNTGLTWQTPLVESAKTLEDSDLDYVILRTTWLYNDPSKTEVDVTKKGEPFKDAQITREAVAKFAADLLTGKQDYHRESLGIGEPNTEWEKPSFY